MSLKLSSLSSAATIVAAALISACATTDNSVPFGIDAGLKAAGGAMTPPGAGGMDVGSSGGAPASSGGVPGGGAATSGGAPSSGGGPGSSGGVGGTCKPAYCPSQGTGMACCTTSDTCGVDFGMGCAPAPRDGGVGSGGTTGSGGAAASSGGATP